MVSLSIVMLAEDQQYLRKRMSTISSPSKNTVPVGKTPVPKYDTWDEHRTAMRLDAENRRQSKNTVPVGKTPVPKYDTWDEHRAAMRRAARNSRTLAERRRVKTVLGHRDVE